MSHKLGGKFLWWSLGDCIIITWSVLSVNLDFLDLMAVVLVACGCSLRELVAGQVICKSSWNV